MGFRSNVKKALEGKELYLRLRYSSFVINGLKFLKPAFASELNKQEKLYSSLLNKKAKLVFDIGGNEGFTAEIFSHLSEKVVVAEPSERNLRVLHARFRDTSLVQIEATALSDRKGRMRFFDNSSNYACSTLEEKWRSMQEEARPDFSTYEVEVTTLDELIAKHGRPDFIKIDVEGHEEAVIRGLTQAVPLLSFEAMLPHFKAEAIRNLNYLSGLSASTVFNFAIDHGLQLEQFVTAEELAGRIERLDKVTIDVFCST